MAAARSGADAVHIIDVKRAFVTDYLFPALQANAIYEGKYLLGTALVATLDEWHQSYIPTRTGTYKDVILDTCAGIGAQLAIFLYHKRRSRRLGF